MTTYMIYQSPSGGWHAWPADGDGEARQFATSEEAVVWCQENGFAVGADAAGGDDSALGPPQGVVSGTDGVER